MSNYTELFYLYNDKNSILDAQKSLALDIFFSLYDSKSFINNPLKKGDLIVILEDCLEAAEYLLSYKEKSNEDKKEE